MQFVCVGDDNALLVADEKKGGSFVDDSGVQDDSNALLVLGFSSSIMIQSAI